MNEETMVLDCHLQGTVSFYCFSELIRIYCLSNILIILEQSPQMKRIQSLPIKNDGGTMSYIAPMVGNP